MTTRKHTLAASLIAILAAAPAMAQQEQTNQQTGTETQTQTGGATQQATGTNQQRDTQMPAAEGEQGTVQQAQTGQTGAETQAQTGQATQQATGTNQQQDTQTPAEGEQGAAQQAQTGQTGEMPEAATPEGQGLSDLADVQTPQGEVGAGQTVMLDIEGFSQTLYERGFRQGYIRGIADARERLISEMRQAHAARRGAMREGVTAQEDRMESAAGGQTRSAPGALDPSRGGEPLGQIGTLTPGDRQGAGQRGRAEQSGAPGQGGTTGQSGTTGQGGAIVVLPPGMDAQTFIERVMEMNEAAQR